MQLGAANGVTLSVQVVENTGSAPAVFSGISLEPHSYAVVVYDGGSGWALGAGLQLIAQTIYANKPAGIAPIGSTSVTIADPVLGSQTVAFSVPTAQRLYVHATVVPVSSPNAPTFASLTTAIQNALAAAAIAPTPSTGAPPPGQLLPGADVIGSQLEAVVGNVPWVYDVQALTFGFSPAPGNTAPLPVGLFAIATLAASDVTVTQGTGP